MSSPIRVVLADDHPIMRAGVKGLIQQETDMVCVGEAQDGVEALAVIQREIPDVAVLDMSMPVLSGIAVARRLR